MASWTMIIIGQSNIQHLNCSTSDREGRNYLYGFQSGRHGKISPPQERGLPVEKAI